MQRRADGKLKFDCSGRVIMNEDLRGICLWIGPDRRDIMTDASDYLYAAPEGPDGEPDRSEISSLTADETREVCRFMAVQWSQRLMEVIDG
jgi:hypothetical protein